MKIGRIESATEQVLDEMVMSGPNDENRVVVNILGEDYPVTGVTDRSYISKVADYVDAKMKESIQDSRLVSRDRVAILAAMSIASELLECQDKLRLLEESLDLHTSRMLVRLDQAVCE